MKIKIMELNLYLNKVAIWHQLYKLAIVRSLTLREEHKLNVFVNKILRRT